MVGLGSPSQTKFWALLRRTKWFGCSGPVNEDNGTGTAALTQDIGCFPAREWIAKSGSVGMLRPVAMTTRYKLAWQTDVSKSRQLKLIAGAAVRLVKAKQFRQMEPLPRVESLRKQ